MHRMYDIPSTGRVHTGKVYPKGQGLRDLKSTANPFCGLVPQPAAKQLW